MKVFYGSEKLDVNSIEMKKLYIKDVYLGDYSYGLYSKLQLVLIDCQNSGESTLRSISGMNTYINGVIYKTFGLDIWELENPMDIKVIIQEKTDKSFNEWLEYTLKEKIKEAEDELKRIKEGIK